MIADDRCGFCRSARDVYGCAPGRCMNPTRRAAGAHELPVLGPGAGARRLEEAPRRPKGPVRLVMAAELRDGPAGGAYWLLELECGDTIFRYAGRAGKRRRSSPGREQCIAPRCAGTITVACAGRCGRLGDLAARMSAWAWVKRAWWCPACWPVVLGWTAEALGPEGRGAGAAKAKSGAARGAKRGRGRR